MFRWRIGLFTVAFFAMGNLSAETLEIRPVSAWTSAETPDVRTLDKVYDGDWSTHAVFLDDSRDGKSTQVHPPFGSTPVTATIVLDLGKVQPVSGIRMVSPISWAYRNAQRVTLFKCDDPEGKIHRQILKAHQELAPVASGNSAFVVWPEISARYIGIQIEDSWNKNHSPGYSSSAIQYDLKNSEFRYRAFPPYQGWNGAMAFLTQRENYDKDFAGLGKFFNIQIAEITCFCEKPFDFVEPNPPELPFPEARLHRDWILQDYGFRWIDCFRSGKNAEIEKGMLAKVLASGACSEEITTRMNQLLVENIPGNDPRWKELYFQACWERRAFRLKYLREKTKEIVYVKHCVLGGWTGKSSTEELSDGEHDIRNSDWRPGSQLCRITWDDNGKLRHEVLLEKPNGLIRDPNFSFDGNTLVFSMRDNFVNDDYHLYLMDMETLRIRQITFSPEVNGKIIPCADIEPAFTAEGNLVFQSTRCGHQDDCWIQSASNIYTCDRNGLFMRRLAYDQVHTHYPQVLDDGRIIFTRWEYNDRNHTFQQPLLTMNSDGTAQTEYYGNNSWYPCSLLHARGIPGTNKVIALVSGHHVVQKGKLAIIDPSRGTQGDAGIEFVAGAAPDGTEGRQQSNVFTGQKWEKGKWLTYIDCFGQTGKQYQYPYAFDETRYLVTFLPEGCQYIKGPFNPPFGIYWMTSDGERELLAFDPTISASQAVPRIVRKTPPLRGSQVDLKQSFGRYYVQNVYWGEGLKDVPPGTIRKLRVVALEFRPTRIGWNFNRGMGGDTPVQTPPSIGNGSYDVKHVLGEVDVESDGSCFFEVPANNAVYFQLLDAQGRCVQTMRSWSTLMPGETFACLGCHEDKRQVGDVSQSKATLAMGKAPQKLQPSAGFFHPLLERLEKEGLLANINNYLGVNQPRKIDAHAPTEGFSFSQRIQPILDKHCISCHPGKPEGSMLNLTGAFAEMENTSLRSFSHAYKTLTEEGRMISCPEELHDFQEKYGKLPLTCWYHAQGPATMLPPYAAGSTQSRLMAYLEPSHYNVQLSEEEKRTIACWIDLAVPFCGAYPQANLWSAEQKERYRYYQEKREIFARQELDGLPQK
ncbi:MAG: hypothetical protein Q4D62_01060 [Planctomycetia bacterium]|nr:hypothetical protein [Planctomycetia bacterium]